jgi:gliding motility-associated-like protein
VLSLNLHVSDQLTAGNDSVISLCETSGTIDLNTLKSADAADGGTWWQEDTQLNSTFWNPGDEGSGVIEYLVNSEEPCPPSTAVFEVVVDEAVDVTLPQEFSACANSPAQQVTPVQAGDYDYSWEESPLLSSQSLSNPWLNFGAVQNSYSINSITVLIENGACQKIDSVLVEVLPYPIVELLGDNSICEDEPYQFTASGADSYQWNGIPLGSELDSISVAGVATSDFDFSVIGLNEFGCEGSAEAFVSVLDTPEVELNVIGEDGCAPVNVQLSFDSQQEIVSYYWVLNGDFVNQEIGSVLELDQPGEHELELNVTASNGCAAHFESAGNFEVYENPVADFLFEDESVVAINPKVSILNTSVAADSYFWNFGQLGSSVEENPTMYFTGEEPGFYEACLTAETDFGCIDTICKTIELEGEYSIYLPNAFTPDGDGLNEVFKPVMQGVDPSEYLFVIFNRWGEKVFESKDPSRGWIGNHRGGNHYVPPAVYNWQLKVKNRFTGEIEKMSGHISVLR